MDIKSIRDDFPITKTKIKTKNGYEQVIYLDHGASTHAPKPVIDKYIDVLEKHYANIHRGAHELSMESTELFDAIPSKIAKFFGINNLEDSGMHAVLTYNTTSSLDLASHVFSQVKGDVLTTIIEHHSNDLPFRRRGNLHHADVLDDGTLNLDDVEEKLQKYDIKLLTVTGASNVTGYMPPIEKLARMAHDNGAKIMVDAAQRFAHYPLTLKPVGHPEHIDFIAAAGHKFYSPFGAAFLFGNSDDFDAAPPYIPGGGVVKFVTDDDVIFETGMLRHQYGTPNIAGSVAMGESIEFISKIGMNNIVEHERKLFKKLERGMREFDDVNLLGKIPEDQKIGVVTFTVDGMEHRDVSLKLNNYGAIATRDGCFCAHPYMLRLLNVDESEINEMKEYVRGGGPPERLGGIRATIGVYNTEEEVDKFLLVMEEILKEKNK